MRKSNSNPARADKERGKGEKQRRYGGLVKIPKLQSFWSTTTTLKYQIM